MNSFTLRPIKCGADRRVSRIHHWWASVWLTLYHGEACCIAACWWQSAPHPMPRCVTMGEMHATAQEMHATAQEMHVTVGEMHATAQEMHATVGEMHATVGELHARAREMHARAREMHATEGEVHVSTREIWGQLLIRYLADTFIQSDFQLSRLRRGQSPGAMWGWDLAQWSNSCADVITETPGTQPTVRVSVTYLSH